MTARQGSATPTRLVQTVHIVGIGDVSNLTSFYGRDWQHRWGVTLIDEKGNPLPDGAKVGFGLPLRAKIGAGKYERTWVLEGKPRPMPKKFNKVLVSELCGDCQDRLWREIQRRQFRHPKYADREIICALRLQGWQIKDIAARLGRGTQTIQNVLTATGLISAFPRGEKRKSAPVPVKPERPPTPRKFCYSALYQAFIRLRGQTPQPSRHSCYVLLAGIFGVARFHIERVIGNEWPDKATRP